MNALLLSLLLARAVSAAPSVAPEKIGAMLMVGFEGTTSTDAWPAKLGTQIEKGEVGGVILFKRNITGKDGVAALNSFFKSKDKTVLVAVDQEGGKVQRLNAANGFESFPSAQEVGAGTATAAEAARTYRRMGKMLAEAGFNVDMAPVVDVDHEPPSPVIGGLMRSFSKDPETVVKYAVAMSRALAEEGVLACVKHFPGHGSAQGDTHEGLVDVTSTWSEAELAPFYRTVRDRHGPRMVMTAHIINTKLDPKYPATFSPTILKDLLRAKLGRDIVVVSDDMHMGAVMKNYGFEEGVVLAVNAGVDLLIFSNNPLAAKGVEGFLPDPDLPARVTKIISDAVAAGRIPASRIEESYRRLKKLKARLKA
ncbi:MAG: glycoside hydrolase family 3 protein [Elusimicrobia bacterium]|nr:glycoside hydrolase family 3 protein [Elusimicrobiota bacterium]